MNKKNAIILIVLTLGLIAVNELSLNKGDAEIIKPTSTSTTTSLIGGAFSLTDQNGGPFTEANLKGKYSLVYFGFTHCPDVCPLALSSMTLALKELGDKGKDFQIIFITADPERDDVKTMKDYISGFKDSPITGLTGTKEQVEKATQVYRVYAEKVISDSKATGEYNVSHSSIIYIMDKNGQFISNLTHETKADDMVRKLKSLQL